MVSGPARQLLDGWEAVRGEPMPVRAAALAALAANAPLGDAMRWSIPARDRLLFDFRARMFGDGIDAVTRCPQCDEPLEMQFSLAALRPREVRRPTTETRTIRLGRQRIRYRLPNSADLLAVLEHHSSEDGRAVLLERCVETTDAGLRERVAARLPSEDTDVRLRLSCPACGHGWDTPFDIATFAWRDVDEWARRTLREIHVLASVYGWTEDQILGLGARRRQTYVEMNA